MWAAGLRGDGLSMAGMQSLEFQGLPLGARVSKGHAPGCSARRGGQWAWGWGHVGSTGLRKEKVRVCVDGGEGDGCHLRGMCCEGL